MQVHASRARGIIGALVGMGPASTAPFYNMLIDEARAQVAARNDDDFPEIVMISLPTPFVLGRPLDDVQFVPRLTGALHRLEAAGADFAAVACNVVHRYMPQMRAATSMEVLDTIELTSQTLRARRLQKTALLATSATASSGLYQQACDAQSTPLYWTSALQAEVDRLIVAVKHKDPPATLRKHWLATLQNLQNAGCDGAVVACTDLSGLAASLPAQHPVAVVDSAAVLAQTCISKWKMI